jgi:hypothetical protein
MSPPCVLGHAVVYRAPGRYGGWPANHGIWAWGDEILAGFQAGIHKAHGQGAHAIDWDLPIRKVFARSRDGGITWALEDSLPSAVDNPLDHGERNRRQPLGQPDDAFDCPGGIDFAHPGFAMTFAHWSFHTGPSRFWASCDRGRSWDGPYRFPDLGTPGIAARTDYLVDGDRACTAFLTAAKPDGREGRPLCARTEDGGRTWRLLSWIGPQPESGFVIMPAAARLPSGEILVLLRAQPDRARGAIQAYLSPDGGLTWSRLADAVPDLPPSNPPALALLRDGRLCLTYGARAAPFRICARLSSDGGRTWGAELTLRDDGASWDLGYTRTVQRLDGAIVTVYYFHAGRGGPERHIGATVWRADA